MQHTLMEIRTAAPEDTLAVLAISQTTPWEKDAYLTAQIGRRQVLVAVQQDVLGFVVWNNEFFGFPFVWLVAVSPEHRRRGIAAQLFSAVETLCAGKRLFSSTNVSNVLMHRFFARRGYRRSGEVDVDPGDAEVFFELDKR
jgi:GNAT superfamily N-acetyltransferase